MTLKNDQKSKEELTFRFKIDIGIWQILTREAQRLKYLHFNELLLTKV